MCHTPGKGCGSHGLRLGSSEDDLASLSAGTMGMSYHTWLEGFNFSLAAARCHRGSVIMP